MIIHINLKLAIFHKIAENYYFGIDNNAENKMGG